MKQEMTRIIGDSAATIAIGGGMAAKLGWFEFINENAQGLGFIASCVFGVIATIFYIIAYFKSTQSDKNKEDLVSLKHVMNKHITETEVSFEKVDNGLDKILTKLNKGK